MDAAALGPDQVAAAGLDDQDLSTAYRILAAKPFSGELQNHNHQDDDHQNADDRTDQSAVHSPSSPDGFVAGYNLNASFEATPTGGSSGAFEPEQRLLSRQSPDVSAEGAVGP